MRFGKWIKKRRRSLRLGLWNCACHAGIGGEALRLIETGKSNPAGCKTSTLYGLARVLKIEPAEIIERAMREDPKLMEWLRREWPESDWWGWDLQEEQADK